MAKEEKKKKEKRRWEKHGGTFGTLTGLCGDWLAHNFTFSGLDQQSRYVELTGLFTTSSDSSIITSFPLS